MLTDEQKKEIYNNFFKNCKKNYDSEIYIIDFKIEKLNVQFSVCYPKYLNGKVKILAYNEVYNLQSYRELSITENENIVMRSGYGYGTFTERQKEKISKKMFEILNFILDENNTISISETDRKISNKFFFRNFHDTEKEIDEYKHKISNCENQIYKKYCFA